MNPEEVDLKGKPVEAIGVVDLAENSYFIAADGVNLFVRQPRPRDLDPMKEGMAKIGHNNWLRYAPHSSIWEALDQAANLPLFHRRRRRDLYMIMVIDDEVVGFSNHKYYWEGEARYVIGGLCLTNPWRGRGVGSLYGKMSEYIAVINGAREFHGQTRVVDGMYNIRQRDGWETLGFFEDKGIPMVTIKKVLPRDIGDIRRMLIGEEKDESPPD
jgi:hypothetical protein